MQLVHLILHETLTRNYTHVCTTMYCHCVNIYNVQKGAIKSKFQKKGKVPLQGRCTRICQIHVIHMSIVLPTSDRKKQ